MISQTRSGNLVALPFSVKWGDHDIPYLLDHAGQLKALVGRMDHRPAEELKEHKAVTGSRMMRDVNRAS